MAEDLDEFEDDQRIELTDEMRERRNAALAHVARWGNPVLRSQTREVTSFDKELAEQASRMERIMDDAIGAGLAAPQVGSLKRMFIYRAEREGPARAVVNPVITWRSEDEEEDFEGCLSLNDVVVEVSRSVELRLEAQDLEGKPFSIEAKGFEARVIQHEFDHLDGILIVDRAERGQRRQALRMLAEASAHDHSL